MAKVIEYKFGRIRKPTTAEELMEFVAVAGREGWVLADITPNVEKWPSPFSTGPDAAWYQENGVLLIFWREREEPRPPMLLCPDRGPEEG